MEKQQFVPGDPVLIENIVTYLKAKGIFDEFRHECLADVDTKSSCQNLSQRVDGYATKFLSNETWNKELNKNELRNKLRKHIDESGMLAVGADHVVEQVINPKIQPYFLPRIIEVVHQYLNEEIEKRNRKQESTAAKIASDNSDKTKLTVLDPIADILSFAYSKPKSTSKVEKKKEDITNHTKPSESSKAEKKKGENVPLSKNSDVTSKVEKKKDEISLVSKVEVEKKEESSQLSKGSDLTTKIEKKKEENIQLLKGTDIILKVEKKKEENEQLVKVSDIVPKIEKKKDENAEHYTGLEHSLDIKNEEMSPQKIVGDNNFNSENLSEIVGYPIKTEVVESINEDSLSSGLNIKSYCEIEDIVNINKDFKMEESDSSSDSQNKILKDVICEQKKSDSTKPVEDEEIDQKSFNRPAGHLKNKPNSDKLKKSSSQNSLKTVCKPVESHQSKPKDPSDNSSSKVSSDKGKTPSKNLDKTSKDGPSKVLKSSREVKSEKVENIGRKSKSKDISCKSSSSLDSPNMSSVMKKSSTLSKLKHKASKDEKPSSNKPPSETSTQLDKGSKSSSQSSSSYESSQGSDQDKSSTSSSQGRQKHFSKHSKTSTDSSDKKRPHVDSDTETSKKHKDKEGHHISIKHKKSIAFPELAQISSRSNSFSSTSDSQTSSKEPTEENSDNSIKKKQSTNDKEPCGYDVQTLPPPPPPPPPPSSSIAIEGSSAEMSSMDDTQSSNVSDSSDSDVEMSSDSGAEVPASPSNLQIPSPKFLKEPELLNDIYDILLFSSSSSEFEGYSSSAEADLNQPPIDVSVSPVDTSDLSSFEDELSEVEYTDDNNGKQVKRFTIKEAKCILEEKIKKRQAEKSKISVTMVEETEETKRSPQIDSSPLKMSSQVEASPSTSEPKRESRRERKLNPKYASNEYASIFNSKRTSFITKQSTPKDEKKYDPVISLRQADYDTPIIKKETSPIKLRISGLNSNDALSICVESEPEIIQKNEDVHATVSKKGLLEPSNLPNHHDKNHNMSETPNRVALKDKKSLFKNDNGTNKELKPLSVKRKLEGDNENYSTKRNCVQNSANLCSSESVANENEPLNKTTNSSAVVDMQQTAIKEFFQKQIVNNNGDVLNKKEHARRNSISKPNHAETTISECD